jgi:peroxiredoxin
MSRYLLAFLIFGLNLVQGFIPLLSSRHTAFMTSTSLALSSTDTAIEVKVGDAIPDVMLTEGQADYGKPVPVNLKELIAGKKVAIFAVPGAFTPGCSKSHLPSFITAMDDLKAKGVELVICVATNDAYVMEAWGRTSGGADAGIRFFSDGTGELTRSLGMTIENPVFLRSKRYSLIADDGIVTHFFSADEDSSNTWAPSVLAAL